MKTETQQLIDALLIRFANRAEKWNMLSIETTEEPKLTYALARKREANSAIGVLQDEAKKLVKRIERDNATPATESGSSPVNIFPLRDIPAGDPFFGPALAERLRVGCSVYEPVTKIGAKIANLRLNNPGSGFHKRCKYLGTILNPSSEDGFETGWSENGFFEVVGERPHSADIVLRYIGLKNQEPVKCDQLDFVKIANDILAGEGKYKLQNERGDDVVLLTAQGRGESVLVGYAGDFKSVEQWKVDGKLATGGPSWMNLVAVPLPMKGEGWYNIGSEMVFGPHPTKEAAIEAWGPRLTNLVARIQVKAGDGL